MRKISKKKTSSLGGLEPPTFRLTAERANRLRHRDLMSEVGLRIDIITIEAFITSYQALNGFRGRNMREWNLHALRDILCTVILWLLVYILHSIVAAIIYSKHNGFILSL